MKKLLTTALVVLSAFAFADDEQLSLETMPSPYFVDGIHCQGFSGVDGLSSNYDPEEAVAIAQKVANQENCEATLKRFGLEKYNWIDPEALEMITNEMKSTGFYREVTLSLKKSELKNHIHVFVKVVRRPEVGYKFTEGFSYFAPTAAGESPRLTNRLTYETQSRGNEALFSSDFGFVLENSEAWSLPTVPDYANDELTKSLLVNRPYYANLYIRSQRAFFWKTVLNLDAHFVFHNREQARKANFEAYVDAAWAYNYRVPYLSWSGTVAFHYLGKWRGAYGISNRFTRGNPDADYSIIEYGAYLKDNRLLAMEYLLYWKDFSATIPAYFDLTLESRYNHGFSGAVDTIPFKNHAVSTVEVGAGTVLRHKGGYTDLKLSFGNQAITGFVDNVSAIYSSPYVGAGYVFKGEELNVEVSAKYFTRRMF